MGILSAIAIGGAFANYKKAKKEYEQALVEDDNTAILAAISQYNTSKYAQLDNFERKEYAPSEKSSFLPVPVINVGNMVGDYCRMQFVFSLMNTSDKITYDITDFEVIYKCYGQPIWVQEFNDVRIPPKSQLYAVFVPSPAWAAVQEKANSKFMTELLKSVTMGTFPMIDELKHAKEMIQRANMRDGITPLISSCEVNTCLIGNPCACSADVWFKYAGNGQNEVGIAQYKDVKGSLCYKGEAFYPNDKKDIWQIRQK